MKKDKNYEILFWKEWLEADSLKRSDMVEKLSILDELLEMKKLKNGKHFLASTLNSFFDDLESAIYTKIRLEKGKRKI